MVALPALVLVAGTACPSPPVSDGHESESGDTADEQASSLPDPEPQSRPLSVDELSSRRPWLGQVNVVSDTGVSGTMILGDELTTTLGRYCATTADVTGDGVPELIERSLKADESGKEGVFDGSLMDIWSGISATDGPERVPDISLRLVSPAGQGIGPTLFFAPGDIDGDGYPDLVVGSWSQGDDWTIPELPLSGSALILSGPIESVPTDVELSGSWIYSQEPKVAYIGTSGASLGDQDDDGNADFALGSGIRPLTHTTGETPELSKAWIIHGPVSGRGTLEEVAHAVVDMETETTSHIGARVTDTGDINGDGILDLAIGGPYLSLNGAASGGVVVMHGPLEGALSWQDHDVLLRDAGGDLEATLVGYDLAGDLDANGDGHVDLWVGIYGYSDDGDGYLEGAASLVEGPLSGDIHMVDEQTALVMSERTDSCLGGVMDGLGDVEGDGRDDVAISAYFDYNGASYGKGSVTVAYGGIQGVHMTPPQSPTVDVAWLGGDSESSRFGLGFAGGQDLDQDGWPDLVIGDPWYSEDSHSSILPGRLFVLFGGPEPGVVPQWQGGR